MPRTPPRELTMDQNKSWMKGYTILLLFCLKTQGHLVLLLNWYPHFLDQSYAPGHSYIHKVVVQTAEWAKQTLVWQMTQRHFPRHWQSVLCCAAVVLGIE